jgi:uncharacterized membrane protein
MDGMWARYWLLISILIIILVAYGVFILLWRHRKATRSSQTEDEPQNPFTLDDLQDMLKKGLIDQDEFKKLRKKIMDECNLDK